MALDLSPIINLEGCIYTKLSNKPKHTSNNKKIRVKKLQQNLSHNMRRR